MEKDMLLHQLLNGLASDSFFSDNFVFKGGTCLIKAYLGYFRFSEDIDFTYLNQGEFEGKSGKAIRPALSKLIDKTAVLLERIAAGRKMDFKRGKKNRDYVELGGSGKIVTFKVWYDSVVLKRRAFIKVQINFIEKLCFNPIRRKLNSLKVPSRGNIEMLYPEYKEFAMPLYLLAYDKREIAAEKLRAILTRRGVKARDFVDLYMLHKRFGIEPSGLERCAVRKARFSLKMYEKYRNNLREKLKERISLPDLGMDRGMLTKINEADFYAFSKRLENYANTLAKEAIKED
jgi:predicted nucleotidyltransferase component of viral defense system